MKKELNIIYFVKKNDTINSIAERYNISAFSILIYNNITPNMLYEGMPLFIKLIN